ncbi:hypothetical protein JQC91_16960 [Jannaschia sp. Os4]|uniref:hypothetical protein n=1 Tax=Jannaschia sp. Os4 TaxID=2807617 RepID=UPI00193A9FD8|nr:hypothetical protein [Jannaschia sp. Os4]MBM2577998.1 hypothetical protein [Jannaschia sp. Os4]
MGVFDAAPGGFDVGSYVLAQRRGREKGLDASEADRVALLTSMIPGNLLVKLILSDRLIESRLPKARAIGSDGDADDVVVADDPSTEQVVTAASVEGFFRTPEGRESLARSVQRMVEAEPKVVRKAMEPLAEDLHELVRASRDEMREGLVAFDGRLVALEAPPASAKKG